MHCISLYIIIHVCRMIHSMKGLYIWLYHNNFIISGFAPPASFRTLWVSNNWHAEDWQNCSTLGVDGVFLHWSTGVVVRPWGIRHGKVIRTSGFKLRSWRCKIDWLVVSTHLKNISQLGWLFPRYGKKCSKPPTSRGCLAVVPFGIHLEACVRCLCNGALSIAFYGSNLTIFNFSL